jgi:hypothetical protein
MHNPYTPPTTFQKKVRTEGAGWALLGILTAGLSLVIASLLCREVGFELTFYAFTGMMSNSPHIPLELAGQVIAARNWVTLGSALIIGACLGRLALTFCSPEDDDEIFLVDLILRYGAKSILPWTIPFTLFVGCVAFSSIEILKTAPDGVTSELILRVVVLQVTGLGYGDY